MSIDNVVREKIETLLNELATQTTKDQVAILCQDKMLPLQSFCDQNYKLFGEYIIAMKEYKVSQGDYFQVLEQIKTESLELRNNLKLILQLFIIISGACGMEEPRKEQEDWLHELTELDSTNN
jgi:hypothetical protein